MQSLISPFDHVDLGVIGEKSSITVFAPDDVCIVVILNLEKITSTSVQFIRWKLFMGSGIDKHVGSVWPTIVIALVTHVASVVFSLLVWRFGSTPDWIVESVTYNK